MCEEVATIKLLLVCVTGSLECGDLGASCESSVQDSSIVVDDDEAETTSKVGDEAIAYKALEKLSLVGENASLLVSPHVIGPFRRRNTMCLLPLGARTSMRSWLR
jgi:hypothetical protein